MHENQVRNDFYQCPCCGRSTQTREVHPTKSEMIWICKNCNWASGRIIVCSVDYINHLRNILSEKKP